MQKNFGASLSESDWGSIDLIIHYLETGRADTLKEALYQLDRQKQNDRIAMAIREATTSINSHIESAFARMGQALAQSFNRLEDSIRYMHKDILESNREARAQNSALMSEFTSKIDRQINATEMNGALLEKANKSSEELLNDLRYNQRFWVK